MPSDSNGVYSLPAGYLATTGLTILASQHNPPLEDIAAGLTARLMRSGVAPMTGPLWLYDGVEATPGLSFNSAKTTGFFKSTNGIGVSVGGDQVADFGSAFSFVDAGDTASANALTLGTGNIFNITGTIAITSIGTKGIGTVVLLRFAAGLTLTHHTTDLILPRNANIITVAGDWALFEEYASGDWRLIGYHRFDGTALAASVPRGYIDGCTLSNGTDATNDIDVAAGVCRDSTNSVNVTVAAMAGKQLDANWAPGAAAGMRNSAVGIANTTYHIYAVAKADGTQDIYAHTSTTVATVITALQAETGGADYLYARRIGSIIRSGGAILAFKQTGDWFEWKTVKAESPANTSTSAANVTVTVPAGISVRGQFFAVSPDSDGDSIYVYSPNVTDEATDVSKNINVIANTSGIRIPAELHIWTNTASQIRAVGSSAATVWSLSTKAYLDSRGKDA